MKIALIVTGIILIFLISGLFYMGIFNKVKISEKKFDSFSYVYFEHKGAYEKIGIPMEKMYQELSNNGLKTEVGIGVYFDDPRIVKKDELRSHAGVIFKSEADIEKALKLNSQYKKDEFAGGDYFYWEFPYRNNLSFMLGAMKFYPAFDKYAQNKGFQIKKSYELYDCKNGKIVFIAL